MLYNLLLGFHVLVCLVLIVVVLLQSSKGGGLAGAFGGGGGQTMFGGGETATFLSRMTTYLAIAFMVLSLFLAFLSAQQKGTGSAPRSIVREAAQQQRNVIPTGQSIDQILGAVSDTTKGAASDTTGGSQ